MCRPEVRVRRPEVFKYPYREIYLEEGLRKGFDIET